MYCDGLDYGELDLSLSSSYVLQMDMAKKKLHRDAVLHCRVPGKVKYGAELLMRKHSASMALIVEKALLNLFKEEGLNDREQGKMESRLDNLWAPTEGERLYRLAVYAPGLMTQDEKETMELLGEFPSDTGAPLDDDEVKRIIAICEQKRGATE